MSKFKTVLFDWEGVVGPQDTRSFGWLMQRLTNEYGVEYAEAVDALGGAIGEFMVGRIDNKTFWSNVGRSLGVRFTDEFQETIWQEWNGAASLPEMETLVREVKLRGLRTLVFSNILPTSAARIRELAGYEGFDAELLSCEVGLKKPDLAIYQKAVQLAECMPEECILIDDKESNLTPARKLGMTTILAKSTEQIRADLLRLVDN